MKIYEIGILRNNERLVWKKYYDPPKDEYEEKFSDLICETFIYTIRNNVEYNNILSSYEMMNFHVSMIGKKNGEKSKFVSYLISDKSLGIDIKKNLLSETLNKFFKKFPAPQCYNKNKATFDSFYDQLPEIVGDLPMKPPDRLSKAFGYE